MPIEVIDMYLTAAEISCHMQDVDLTPQDYDSPVKHQEKDIPGPLYRDLHQDLCLYASNFNRNRGKYFWIRSFI